MAVGTFDILHLGHVHYLTEARDRGDHLTVVVATDATVRARKGEPIFDEEARRRLVASLKPVDEAIVGREDDHLATVERVDPDLIALGYDQHHREQKLEEDLADRGLEEIAVERMPAFEAALDSSSRIVERILEIGPDKLKEAER